MAGLMGVNQIFGNDVLVNSVGDYATVSGIAMGQQRVLRRLLTPVNGYIWHPGYGAGLPQKVGQPLTDTLLAEVTALIRSNIFRENCVSQNPQPVILLQIIPQGLFIQIDYTDSPSGQPTTLQFTVNR